MCTVSYTHLLIKAVVNQATIPVIETGTGNCHIFVDETADFDMAMDIILNAKTQRIGVCNACESLVIHEKIADTFLPELMKRLAEKNVEVHGDEKVMQIAGEGCMKRELLVPATEEDWGSCLLYTSVMRLQILETSYITLEPTMQN